MGCKVCTKTEGLKTCNGCKHISYCSRECQKIDWPSHKPTCKALSRTLDPSQPVFTPRPLPTRPILVDSITVVHKTTTSKNHPARRRINSHNVPLIYHGILGDPTSPFSPLFRLIIELPKFDLDIINPNSPADEEHRDKIFLALRDTVYSKILTEKDEACAICRRRSVDFSHTQELRSAGLMGGVAPMIWDAIIPYCDMEDCDDMAEEVQTRYVEEGNEVREREMKESYLIGCAAISQVQT
ncbi:hypothetical protein BJ508DRAFT_375909 [Ascobolus immersus RN42]|uniref:MYND-type domain-containing protein n=1 Tax=Ascobolus immersus RN42 TaxID=1160509 RepID=A0A3N4IC37_ASCIM|nr:hypothetical protein BJ508DRAFT_375909 [Ascobolus immersus RN42]